MELLLLSNSTCPGKRYLEHAIVPISDLLRGRRRALFIPFSGVIVDWDAYTDKVRQALEPLTVEVTVSIKRQTPVRPWRMPRSLSSVAVIPFIC